MAAKLQYALTLTVMLVLSGCSEPVQPPQEEKVINPRDTIGSVSSFYMPKGIFVRGIGIVAGLAGTGSSECPPKIRPELEKYIRQQVTEVGTVNPRTFIESQNTAVVEISGFIPSLSTTTEGFDVILRPLSSTQTTSLEGGYLYTAQLKEVGRLTSVDEFTRYTKTLATAEGPVYTKKTNTPGARKSWYILGGGIAKESRPIKLIINEPAFMTASAIRNRINERFGPKVASAVSPAEINIAFPIRYRHARQRFLNIIQTLILGNNPDILNEYTQSQIASLLAKKNIETTKDTLEGIGKPALDMLAPLLKHQDPEIRFSAAQCMLRIGDNRPIALLRSIILEKSSPYRLDAIRAVGQHAKRHDALAILKGPLADPDISIRLLAYEMLAALNSPDISRKVIAKGSFFIDSVVCSGPKQIYVYRQETPVIVLFGSPVYCNKNIFIQSDDATVTLNAKPTDKYISVSRKHPHRPRVVGPLASSFEMSVLLQTLGEFPDVEMNNAIRPGLAVPYSDIVGILRKMCEQNAVTTRFFAGPEPDLEAVLQNSPRNGR